MGQSLKSLLAPSLICERRLLRRPAARLAPMLFQQRDAVHGHAPVHGFAHVVNGEQGNLHGRQNFMIPIKIPN